MFVLLYLRYEYIVGKKVCKMHVDAVSTDANWQYDFMKTNQLSDRLNGSQ